MMQLFYHLDKGVASASIATGNRLSMISDYQAKYYAYGQTREGGKKLERLPQPLPMGHVGFTVHIG